MESVSHKGQDQGYLGAGNFTVYADFNCPFCYALNERLHAMDLDDRVDFRSVQHAPSISSDKSDLAVLVELTREVAELRRRAPSIRIAVPLFRPGSAPASQLLDAVSRQDPACAVLLRRAIFRALWIDGLDISSAEVLESLLAQLDIDLVLSSVKPCDDLSDWQIQWDNDDEFNHNVPIVISDQGEKVIGFPLESELNAFLQTGSLVSDEILHESVGHKRLQRILVLDNDVPGLQMLIEQMGSVQVEIVEKFNDLVEAALDHGMPDSDNER